jgi:subtilase family serine protease
MIFAAALNRSVFLSNSFRNAWLAIVCLAALVCSASAQGAGRQVLQGHVSSAVAGSRALHPLDRSAKLNISIGLPLRNGEQLDALLAQISDPTSPNYRHFLTPEQFAERFGPTESDYQAITAFAKENGLTVTRSHSNRMVLGVSGGVSDVEKTFHVKMTSFTHPTRGDFFSADREPSVDTDVKIAHISGLSNFSLPKPMDIQAYAKADVTGSAPNGSMIGNDYRAAYAPNVSLTGSGQSVALLEFDGFYSADLTRNFAAANLPAVPVNTFLMDGMSGVAGQYNDEVMLDIMMAAYMAPGLSNITVYEGTWPDDILCQIATDDTARQISSSWGFDTDDTIEQLFKQFQAQGQSFFQASGDSGAYMGGVFPPSDDPNVTVVGGTSLATSGADGPWSAETAWGGSGGGISWNYPIPSYQKNLNLTASGGSQTMRNLPDVSMIAAGGVYLICNNGSAMTVGGTSASAPLWAGFTALVNQQAVANGNPTVGFLNPAIYAIGNSGNYSQDFHDIRAGSNGGYTSTVGYDLVTGWGSPTGQHLIDDLSDASTGSFAVSVSADSLTLLQSGTASMTASVTAVNGFKGAVGFESTGLPAGVTMSVATAGGTNTLTFTASSLAAPGTYPVNLLATSGSFTATTKFTLSIPTPFFNLSSSVASLTTLVGGANAASTISVLPQNNFNSSVSLAVSGLPAGMTAAFSAATTKTTSQLTLKPTASTVPGVYPVIVTGTSPTVSGSTNLTLVVPTPSFGLTPAVSSLNLLVGGSPVATTVSISNPVGIYGSIALSVSGLPGGVTAVLGTPNATTSSYLTFTAGAALVPGTYPVTVTGTSFNISASTTVTLVVPNPSFSLSASVSNPTLLVGGANVASTITVGTPVGLAAKVALAVSGLPSGVTAAFSYPSTSTTSALTFTPSAAAVPGIYAVTVSGTSATASSSTVLTVTIPVPSFSLSASVSNPMLLVGGANVASTITVGTPVGLAAKVALAVSGLPSGVTAVFSYPSTSTTSALTFTPSAAAVPGIYAVTVSGTSATASSSTVLTVTIPVPSFSLSASVSNPTLLVGGANVASTISVVTPVGLAAKVALTVSGLPSGVTAVLSAPSTSTTCALTFTPSAAAVPGIYAVTVSGTSATASSSTVLTVTIPVPSFSLSASVSNPTLLVGGANVASTITVGTPVGLAAKVALTVSGLPSGVTAVLSAPSTSTTSALTFTPSAAAVPGTYPVTVSGTSATASSSTVLTVTVPVPSFSLSASASNPTLLVGGANVASTISVVTPVGLAAKVALTVSGLPSGVTAVLSAPSTSTTSALTFTPSASAVPGTYPVTVSGTSATASSSTVLTVTVPVPSFSLSASVSNPTLLVGGANVASTISVVTPVGLAAKVALTVSGLPSGVTAVLSAASTSTTSALTFTPSATAVPGTYAVTVSGTSATASSSTVLKVAIPVPSFTLAASVSSLSPSALGKSVVTTISVKSPIGLSKSVALTVAGLPNGVTAALSAASTSTSSNLTLTPGTSAVAGSYSITVTGVSGIASGSTTIQLIVP